MKKSKKLGTERGVQFTTQQLRAIWRTLCADRDAGEALKRLDEAGFELSRLIPSDATFKHPCWADYIAALPLLPNQPSTPHIHRKVSFQKHLPLVHELREFAAKITDRFVDVKIQSERDLSLPAIAQLSNDLLKAASMLEHFLSWDYYLRQLNPRNVLIAELRWNIRYRTGRPHDRELSTLIDAAFRAAGYEDGCFIDATTLDRIEKREKECRVKANKKLHALTSAASPLPQHSTRIHRNPRKRV